MREVDIKAFIDIDYNTEIRVNRRKNYTVGPKAHEQAVSKRKPTAEYFTPYSIVKRMCDKIPDKDWSDSTKLLLEPSFGNGNFLCMMIYYRLTHGIDWETTLSTLYGVELMEDNVKETKERILSLLDLMEVDYDRDKAIQIMDKNLVCSDFFKWDFNNWRPIEPECETLF